MKNVIRDGKEVILTKTGDILEPNEPIVEFKNVSKRYKLYKDNRQRIRSVFHKNMKIKTKDAVKDMSFSVRPGEAVAFVGSNGAGKSTILKMITGVCFPTKGEIEVKGRVSALLELTAGFEKEMTGRENIYLRGTTLGLTREEISALEPEIIEFADIGDYIDQPVRSYSSGMKARLGFAINANVQPEILIVDEALSVGDADFKQKCLNKVKQLIADENITLLLVTHNSSMAEQFCERGIFIKSGKMIYDGDVTSAVEKYEEDRLKQKQKKDAKKKREKEIEKKLEREIQEERAKVLSEREAKNKNEKSEETKMKTTLVIMAAGIGSRFGGGIKQIEPVGTSGELIIDYSIHDAIEAGFDKVVFIIRKDLDADFREVIGDRTAEKIEVDYAYQELENLPEGFEAGERTKPWGTGQAILACKDVVKEPFAIINADDYYGKECFKLIHDWLADGNAKKDDKHHFCMAGFKLKNTLSDNGGVTRGVCKEDKGLLTEIIETSGIEKIDGKAAVKDGNDVKFYDDDTLVSMNMWGMSPEYFEDLEKGFIEFLSKLPEGDLKSEYLIPIKIGEDIADGKVDVEVLPTNDRWFGITYHEDAAAVKQEFKKLVENGVYPESIK